ncbi:MAG: BON domain-containing protein [Chromatiales bacterium]|nr:BON domain-containing protein [Chromatiales bacterium]
MKRLSIALIVLTAVTLLQGCAAIVVGGAATGVAVIHDRRSAGTVIDDQGIELKMATLISEDGDLGKHGHVNATSYNYVLLLTGQAENEQYRSRYQQLTSKIPGVKKVVNEIQVAPNTSLTQRTTDTYTTSKAKVALAKIELPGFDPTRIKVVTENGVVYLLGLVTAEEANAAVEKIRYLRGVKQVVKVFEYI